MNREINIIYRGKKPFDIAMQMAWVSEYENDKTSCNGYVIENNIMILSAYCDKPEITKFPYKFNLQQTIDFVWGWLESVTPIEEEPDTDGSVEKGFTVTTNGTDWRGRYYGTLIAIKPTWIIYGK